MIPKSELVRMLSLCPDIPICMEVKTKGNQVTTANIMTIKKGKMKLPGDGPDDEPIEILLISSNK